MFIKYVGYITVSFYKINYCRLTRYRGEKEVGKNMNRYLQTECRYSAVEAQRDNKFIPQRVSFIHI